MNIIKRLLIVLAIALFSAALISACGKNGGGVPNPFVSLAQETGTMFSLHNATRANEGVAALTANAVLDQIAQQQADYEASIQDFSHVDASGHHVDTRATDAGYAWTVIGENVGFDVGANELYSAWLLSSGHRANIVDPSYSEIGIGVTRSGLYEYWCIVFGHQ
jgi:uncharacterized protein YkwD